MTADPVTPQMMAELVAGWPGRSQRVAADIIERHGYPDEATSDRLLWYNPAPLEEMNCLVLNLAQEVATGHGGVDDARRAYTDMAMRMLMGHHEDLYTSGLLFDVGGHAADRDHAFPHQPAP